MLHVLSILVGALLGAALIVNQHSHLILPDRHVTLSKCEALEQSEDTSLESQSDEIRDACALLQYGHRYSL
jgi:hypothetical protein